MKSRGYTPRKIGWLARFRAWLVDKLIEKGVAVEMEIRHGAYRARVRRVWHGPKELLRGEIPVSVPQPGAGTPTPFGFVPAGQEQEVIDQFTAVEGSEFWPDSKKISRTESRCPFCGAGVDPLTGMCQ